jgi:hypothetical protein
MLHDRAGDLASDQRGELGRRARRSRVGRMRPQPAICRPLGRRPDPPIPHAHGGIVDRRPARLKFGQGSMFWFR